MMNGKDLRIYMNNVCIAASTECSIEVNHSPIEVIPSNDWRWKEIVEGKRDWSVRVNGLVVSKSNLYNALNVFDDLAEPVLLQFVENAARPQDAIRRRGYAYPTNARIVAKNEKCVTYAIDFAGTGKLENREQIIPPPTGDTGEIKPSN